MDKKGIANSIKPISHAEVVADFVRLNQIDLSDGVRRSPEGRITKVKGESKIGNKFLDFFTFEERLNTRTRKGMNFYEFMDNKEYHARPYIRNLLVYQQNLKVNELTKLYRIYSLHCGSVALFKPLKAKQIYEQFKPTAVLDPCMGWGGRLLGAVSQKVPHYIGIDLNVNLKEAYQSMVQTLNELTNLDKLTKVDLHFCDAVGFDYSTLKYDMIFTSPPYFNIELYSHTNKKTKQEWVDQFYKPLFQNTFQYLLVGGWMCINVSKVIYDSVFVDLFGLASIVIPMALKVRPKQSQSEFIYCWQK
jgi:hypothetical protein